MSYQKLSDADKHDILNRYRQPQETTQTIANHYGVSHSTISRILKSGLSETEYEILVEQKKRSGRSHSHASTQKDIVGEQSLQEQNFAATVSSEIIEEPASAVDNMRRRRKRSSVEPELEEASFPTASKTPIIKPKQQATVVSSASPVNSRSSSNVYSQNYGGYAQDIEEIIGEDLLDREEELGEDIDDDEDDLEYDIDDDEDDLPLWPQRKGRLNTPVQVLPLSEAFIPKICYLVIDRSAELIAQPLKEFSDLGQIPMQEVMEKTLPIFDNHRVARRFSNRTQRIIKVPDGRMLQKARPYLQAKGITRLLIDGQVYSL